MDAQIEELRHAHHVPTGWYAERLVGVLESMPVERAMLDLFSELTLAAGLGAEWPTSGAEPVGSNRTWPRAAFRRVASTFPPA